MIFYYDILDITRIIYILKTINLDNILKIVAIITILGTFWGIINYFETRRQENQLRKEDLAWRKTRFILELARDFEKDIRIQHCVQMIELNKGIPRDSSLERILGPNIKNLSPEELEKRYELDRYFDFFDRLYHFTSVTKTLSLNDVECFLWFIRRIAETPSCANYCKREGYDDVLELKQRCDDHYGKYSKPLTDIE